MAGTGSRDQGSIETVSVGEIEVEEVECESATEATIEGRAEPAEDVKLAPEEEADLDQVLRDAAATAAQPEAVSSGLGAPGGRFGGSEQPVRRAMAIGTRNGLTITSTKRSTGPTTSDHHTSQRRSFAADMSNGSSPTPQMDRTCHEIATLLGHPEFRAGNLRVVMHGYRVQLLYRTNIGGNHFNHVHVGIRMT